MAGWTALVRRGTWRLVAGGVALVALVAVVVLIAAGSLVRTVVLIGLVLMSTATARVALGHDLAEVPADLRPVERARHGVLLMNPRSGGGKVERFGLEAEARRRGSRRSSCIPATTCGRWPSGPSTRAPTCWAWLAATARRRWSRTSRGARRRPGLRARRDPQPLRARSRARPRRRRRRAGRLRRGPERRIDSA